MVPCRSKRHPELTRLYVAVGLVVVIVVIILVYKSLAGRIAEGGLDAPSRWALMAVGVANVLAIGTLLFIVARSLAKLYFERKSGILGSRLRTRLVLTLFVVGIVPSLILFLVGRNFISKNVERWFSPETEQVIREGKKAAEDLRAASRSPARFRHGPPAGLPLGRPRPWSAPPRAWIWWPTSDPGAGGAVRALDLLPGPPPPQLSVFSGTSRPGHSRRAPGSCGPCPGGMACGSSGSSSPARCTTASWPWSTASGRASRSGGPGIRCRRCPRAPSSS